MGQLTAQRIKDGLLNLLGRLDSTDELLLSKQLMRKTVSAHVTDGGTAGTAQTETFAWQNNTGGNVRVISANAIAPIAVTANGSNYASFLLYKRTSAGASQATIATFATDTVTTDDMVAFAPKAMTLTVANVVVPDGYVVTVAVTKTGTGVALAAATSQARIEFVVEPE